ncbi:amino acid permease [Marinococcus halophilus]|uniref:Amino acid permease n=1 Tax=Marinococcus halophilus TaxID=1371 RepID=A0A510Y7X5_MARHA|nr:APC family permease [Marinococcus halophilus]OZT79593.1 amino acid permease [Marinococcus halophilus]GEK59474.1 amino acid permease [Marinococcus halophilus]
MKLKDNVSPLPQENLEGKNSENNQLQKTLKPKWVWAIALGSAVGWGAFVQPVQWLGTAGPLGVILGMTLGALLMMVIGFCYGYLIQTFPFTGGGFTYAYYGFGKYHAYVCGWFLALAYACIIALNASALGLMFRFLLPELVSWGYMYSVAGWEVYAGEVLISCIAIIVFAIFNIRGASFSGSMQYWFVVVLILGALAISIGIFFSSSSSLSFSQPLFNTNITSFEAIFSILAIAPWAYIGFDNVPQAAEEFNFKPKKAFALIAFSLICASLVYSLMVFATTIASPWQDLVNAQHQWGTGEVVRNTLGITGVSILAIALSAGIFTGLNGFYVATSRLLFAMGRSQIFPSAFGKLHHKYKTPNISIMFICLLCLISPFFGREALNWIVDMSSIGVTVAFLYCCLASYKIFAWNKKESLAKNKFQISPKKKIISVLGVFISVGFILLLIVPGSPGALAFPSWIAMIVWILIGFTFFQVNRKKISQLTKEELDMRIIGKDSK